MVGLHVWLWHMCENTLETEICPMLAMERNIFHSHRLWNQTLNYLREKICTVNIHIFYLILLKNMKWSWSQWGSKLMTWIPKGPRKDEAKIVSDGYTVSPPIALLCTMCGWYMVIVKEIYLKYDAVEYQYVVWCAYSIYQNQNYLHANQMYLILLSSNLTRISC